MLDPRRARDRDDLARANDVAPSYVSGILRLTLFAPDIVEAILDGRQSAELQLDNLLGGFPLEWAGSANPWRSARLKRLVSGATAALY